MFSFFFFFQAEDGIRDRSPSRGLGDVYKRQVIDRFIDRFVSRFRYYCRTVFGTTDVPFLGQLAYRFWVVPFLGRTVFGTSVFGPILYVQKVLIRVVHLSLAH